MKQVLSNRDLISKALILCGILSSAWYVTMNIYVPTRYEGYNILDLTVSELSAIGSPTRPLWVGMAFIYILLFFAFGCGILAVERYSHSLNKHNYSLSKQNYSLSKQNHSLQIVGWLIIVYCIINVYWPPMHQRGVTPTLTDTLHIVWTVMTVIIMLILMFFGATAFGTRFRIYTFVSILLQIFFGFLTSIQAQNIVTNKPTPWMGMWERINIGIFMVWIIAFAIVVLKKERLLSSTPDWTISQS
ncbi:DUF998 domain-containing protein [Xanthocytophaga agilis]|uniref:DUF998 domain-containing protein n=1 Tax=Xanthocytophaga agilis TaxID=3048010 RepID=A0AAE3RD84_9BACT|nr:DUF998 domain-containing protein [Xanthocytophaga agilis]MDJ1506424.1 DUF998 domain-containing protein [Xanthocytophaga agilis]